MNTIIDILKTSRSFLSKTFEFGFLQRQLAKRLFAGHEQIFIQSGPFEGLLYIDAIGWSSFTPKWIGTYENELHRVVSFIIELHPPLIIDIGSAEGYYTAGFGMRLHESTVYSFEIDSRSARLQRQIVSLNGLTNVKISEQCTSENLADLVNKRLSFILCDIEGSEYDLFQNSNKLLGALENSFLLIELHKKPVGNYEAGIEFFKNTFKDTHVITIISAQSRKITDLPNAMQFQGVDAELLYKWMDEKRNPEQKWVFLTPINSPSFLTL